MFSQPLNWLYCSAKLGNPETMPRPTFEHQLTADINIVIIYMFTGISTSHKPTTAATQSLRPIGTQTRWLLIIYQQSFEWVPPTPSLFTVYSCWHSIITQLSAWQGYTIHSVGFFTTLVDSGFGLICLSYPAKYRIWQHLQAAIHMTHYQDLRIITFTDSTTHWPNTAIQKLIITTII